MMFVAMLCCLLGVTFVDSESHIRHDPLRTEVIVQGKSCASQQWNTVDGRRPYPNMCHKYYECTRISGGKFVWKTRTCPEGEQFDKHLSSCNQASRVQCTDTYGGSCTLEDFGNGFGKLRPVPEKCNKFYQCTRETVETFYWIEKSCPANLRFNVKKQECDRPKNVDCDEYYVL